MQERSETSNLRDYLRLAVRRKWVILLAVVLVPLAAVAFSLRQPSKFEACAEVLLSRQQFTSAAGGSGIDTGLSGQPDRVATTQAQLARVPAVIDRTLAAVKLKKKPTASKLLKNTSVKPSKGSDVLTFCDTDRNQASAPLLATQYALAYVGYRQDLDTAAIRRARDQIQSQLNALIAQGDRTSAEYQSLVDKKQQLDTIALLQSKNASLIKSATHAKKTQPRPLKSGAIGLGLGILLGLALAVLWETFDTRVRTAEAVAERLGLPLLGRIPEPPRRLRGENHLLMLEDPAGREAEAFRVLRTNLEFANLERGARTILITSAIQGEGKSTTAANLAVSLAYAGRHVVLVNLDLRRPHRNVIFRGGPGLTDVALGRMPLEETLYRVPLTSEGDGRTAEERGLLSLELGVLEALDSGPLPPNPGDFLLTGALAGILHQLAERADVVLIDAPPLLTVGDSLILSSKIDAVLLVTRIRIVRRPMLNELRRVLQGSPAVKLGFVVTGAEAEEGYAYDYGRLYRLEPHETEELR